MSKRYGRNQKNAHRKRIEFLEIRVKELETRLRVETLAGNDAINLAFQKFLADEGRYLHVIRTISAALGERLGRDAAKVLEKLQEKESRPYFTADNFFGPESPMNAKATRITGSIPSLHFQQVVMSY